MLVLLMYGIKSYKYDMMFILSSMKIRQLGVKLLGHTHRQICYSKSKFLCEVTQSVLGPRAWSRDCKLYTI